MSYEPRWDIDLRDGTEGEALVREILTGRTVEVKTDRRALETGNVYVELFQSRNGKIWKRSGLYTTEAVYWAFVLSVNPASVVIVDTESLRTEVDRLFWTESRKEQTRGEVHTVGVVIPLRKLIVMGVENERTD